MASLAPFPQHRCGKKQTQEAGSDPAELKPQQSSAREGAGAGGHTKTVRCGGIGKARCGGEASI
jgi:hypothetical protein